jgi:hypothetical protein
MSGAGTGCPEIFFWKKERDFERKLSDFMSRKTV